MGRCGDNAAARAGILQNRHGKRRALDGVCSRAELVEEKKRSVAALFEHVHDVHHVRREGGERLLDALLVADVRKDFIKYGNAAALCGGNVQAALRHKAEKADGLERNGLAAGVRAGDDERIVILAELHIDRHGLVLIEQRMARPAQPDAALGELRRAGIQLEAEFCPREDAVEPHERGEVGVDILAVRGTLGGKLRENALDLRFFLRFQLADLVVCLDRRHRLDEERGAGGRNIVHEPRNAALAFGLDRNNVAIRARRDDRVLQKLRHGRRGDDLLQAVAHASRRRAHFAADVRKLTARAVGDLILAGDGVYDLVLQKAVRLEHFEKMVDARLLLGAHAVGAHGASALQHTRDLEKLARIEHAAHIGTGERAAHIAQTRKRRAALIDHHVLCIARLGEQPFDLRAVDARHESERLGLRRFGHRLPREHFQHRRKFESIS